MLPPVSPQRATLSLGTGSGEGRVTAVMAGNREVPGTYTSPRSDDTESIWADSNRGTSPQDHSLWPRGWPFIAKSHVLLCFHLLFLSYPQFDLEIGSTCLWHWCSAGWQVQGLCRTQSLVSRLVCLAPGLAGSPDQPPVTALISQALGSSPWP